MTKPHQEINDHPSSSYEGLALHKPFFPYPYIYPTQESNLLDYWRVFVKRKWFILAFTLICTGLALGISLVLPKKYKVEVTLMPITGGEGGGLGALTSQVGSMPLVGSALGDLSKLGGGKTKELINILKSRSLNEKIINQFGLLKNLFEKQYDVKTDSFHAGFPAFLKPIPVLEDGVKKFKRKVLKVDDDKKTGLIKINVTMKDPILATKVANRMVAELQDFIENNSLTRAKRNRIFLEEQLVKTRAKVLEAGKEQNEFFAGNKISSVVPQLDVDVGSYQISPKPFADFKDEFDSLVSQHQRVEEQKARAKVSAIPSQIYLQFLTLNRELLAKTYGLLMQQYELAKIEEAREDLAFQVIDKAEVPVRSVFPRLNLNLLIGFGGGLFLAIFLVIFLEYIETLKKIPT